MVLSQQSHHRAYIGLGSNIPDRERNLYEAVKLLQLSPEIQAIKSSAIYETDPVGFVDQPLFLNQVILIETTLSAPQLFARMLEVEQQLGRVRHQRWGPRTIDLDLLLFGNATIQSMDLIIPHPRMMERAFVLIPLAEIIDQDYEISGVSFKEHLRLLQGMAGVKRWK